MPLPIPTIAGLQCVLLLTAAAAALARKRADQQGCCADQQGCCADLAGDNKTVPDDESEKEDVTILVGTWSAAEIMLVATLCLIILLILMYMAYQRHRAQRALLLEEQRQTDYAAQRLRMQATSSPARHLSVIVN